MYPQGSRDRDFLFTTSSRLRDGYRRFYPLSIQLQAGAHRLTSRCLGRVASPVTDAVPGPIETPGRDGDEDGGVGVEEDL